MISTWATGRYSASAPSEGDALFLPRRPISAGSQRGVLFCHGAEGSSVQMFDPTLGYEPTIAKLAGQAELPVVAADLGSVLNTSDVWGDDTGMSRMTDAWNWLKSTSGGKAKTDACVLVGGSMGGLMAIDWAYRNPTLVKAIAIIIPVLDLQDVYQNNRSGLEPQINAAYGGAPDYSTRSPMNLASSLAGMPIKIWYSTTDPVTPSTSTNTTFQSSVGSSCLVQSLGAVGHTFSAVNPDDILSFLSNYL